MWWCNDRRTLRGLVRVSIVIAMGALNAACFQPTYASRTFDGGPGVGTSLAQVSLERIDVPNGTPDARIAVELQNAVDFELHGGNAISPTHQLKIKMTTNRSSIITDSTTGRVLAEITGIDATYTLIELATGKTVLTSRTFSRVSSDYPGQQQRFARVRARIDAEDRAAKVLAENISTRLASYFISGS